MQRTLQHFDPKYLEHCQSLSPVQILRFLEDFRSLHISRELQQSQQKLISLKVPEKLLRVFKQRAEANNLSYQAEIKRLMLQSLLE